MNIDSYKYQKILDNSELEDGRDSQSIASNSDTHHSTKSSIEKSKVVPLPSKSIYPTLKSKRELKLIQKVHLDNIISYLSTQKKLSYTTYVEYANVIASYLKFSPNCEIGDYERYLRTLLRQKVEDYDHKLVVKGTLIKHARVIKDYLHYVYREEPISFEVEHYKKPKNIYVYPYPKVEKEVVFGYYSKLIENSKIEDAVLIHTMFYLGFEPYTLSLLKFESISELKTISYFDHKQRSSVKTSLSNELYGDLMLLKTFKKISGELDSKEVRRSLDGSLITGTFIFSTSPTGIYNRFKRKFGGVLDDFNLTPKELVVLSKYYKQKGETRFYP